MPAPEHMTEQERNTCQATSAALIGMSRMCLVIFITTPAVFFKMQFQTADTITILFLMIFISSVLFVGILSWHIYFDGMLLKSLGYGQAGIAEIDLILLNVFRKDLHNKALNERIDACYRLSRKLLAAIAIHILIFAGLIIFLLTRS